jgi:hypothetical protein
VPAIGTVTLDELRSDLDVDMDVIVHALYITVYAYLCLSCSAKS